MASADLHGRVDQRYRSFEAGLASAPLDREALLGQLVSDVFGDRGGPPGDHYSARGDTPPLESGWECPLPPSPPCSLNSRA